MVQQNAWVVLLFNGKVRDVNGLVTNSYGQSWDSSCEKYWVPVQKYWVPDIKNIQVCNWKCFGLCVTRQLWLMLVKSGSPSKGGFNFIFEMNFVQRQKSLNLYGLRLIGPTCKLWNELDERFKYRTSNQFKKELTSHFISLY